MNLYIIDIIDGIRILLWVFFSIGIIGTLCLGFQDEDDFDEEDEKDNLLDTGQKITLITAILLIFIPSHQTLLEILK